MKIQQIILVLSLMVCNGLKAQVDDRWIGKWTSDDEKTVLTISKSAIERKEKTSNLYVYKFYKDEKSLGPGTPGFGLLNKSLVPSNIPYSQNFKNAIVEFQKNNNNNTDYQVRDPKLMLQAINGMPSGNCLGGIWIYDGDDNPSSNYFVNGNKMLEIFDGHYGYSIRLFNRVGSSSENKKNHKKSNEIDITGGVWVVEPNIGQCEVVRFLKNGLLRFSPCSRPDVQYTNGAWTQRGNDVYFQMNGHYAEFRGKIMGSTMEGKAQNRKGLKWTWVATNKP